MPSTFATRKEAERTLAKLAGEGRAHVRRDDRFRALVPLATFANLRWGEAVALQRQDADLAARTVTVRRQYLEMDSGDLVLGPPKSRAGVRTVVFPASIVPAIRDHLDRYTAEDPAALATDGDGTAVPVG